MHSENLYTSVWYHCTMPGWHNLIFSKFRVLSLLLIFSLLQSTSTLCLDILLVSVPSRGIQTLLMPPWAREAVVGSSAQWHFPWEFPNSDSAAIFARYCLLMHWSLEGRSRPFHHAACCLLGSFGKLPWRLLWRVRKAGSVLSIISAEERFVHMVGYCTNCSEMLHWFRHTGLGSMGNFSARQSSLLPSLNLKSCNNDTPHFIPPGPRLKG